MSSVESMTLNSMEKPPPGFTVNSKIFDCPNAAANLIPMGYDFYTNFNGNEYLTS